MASLADTPDLVGFFSYSREDDEGSGGRLLKLRERIQEELRAQLGRTQRRLQTMAGQDLYCTRRVMGRKYQEGCL